MEHFEIIAQALLLVSACLFTVLIAQLATDIYVVLERKRIMSKEFRLAIHQKVSLALSSEEGVVRSRLEHFTGNHQYYVAYKAADGRMAEAWIDDDMLNKVE